MSLALADSSDRLWSKVIPVLTVDPFRMPAPQESVRLLYHDILRWMGPQSFLKASLTFSPACLRLLTLWSLLPSRSICSTAVALPRFSLAAPLASSFLFFSLSSQPIVGLLSRVRSP